MRLLIILILFLPLFGQTQSVYVQLKDASGKTLTGTSVARFYERWMPALTINAGSANNNTVVSFTTTISGGAADLKRIMQNKEFLSTGFIVAKHSGELQMRYYTINMEKIRVTSCTETMGCDGNMVSSVTLQATRIGWTYYQPDKSNTTSTISGKYGYDAETKSAWTNF
jgi:hypothetical protein